jgi:hypothetical protein
MSNAQVGNVYGQIISDVIDISRVDFEEGGVDEAVLEELKTVRRGSCPVPVLDHHRLATTTTSQREDMVMIYNCMAKSLFSPEYLSW